MWVASVDSKMRDKDTLKVTVRFYDDADKAGTEFTKIFTASAFIADIEWLKRQVKGKLNELLKIEQVLASVSLGELDTTPVTPAPTAEQQAYDLYRTKLDRFRHMQNGVNLGIFTGQESEYATLKSWLQNNFQNAFLDLI